MGLPCVLILLLGVPVSVASAPGLVAHYAFDEGEGETLHDRSGNGHHGNIIGAQWTTRRGRSALRFDGSGDYVDFGDNRALKITGDSTYLAWVHLDASPHPDDATNWTVFECEDYRSEGIIVRIDGAASKLLYRASHPGASAYRFGMIPLDNHASYFIAVTKRGETVTTYVDGIPDVQITVKDMAVGAVPFKISSTSQSFAGTIDTVTVFDHALSTAEIVGRYWAGAAQHGKDASLKGKLRLRPFVYYDDRTALVEVDLFGVVPLRAGEIAAIELGPPNAAPVQRHEIPSIPDTCRVAHRFDLSGLSPGVYEIRAMVRDAERMRSREAVTFHYPAPAVTVPAPAERVAGPLPAPARPADCRVDATPGGGCRVSIEGQSFPITSSFTFPNAGENKLVCAEQPDAKGEKEWNVRTTRVDDSTWQVEASGSHYALSRRIVTEPGRVVISDTIKNPTSQPVGIRFRNRVALKDRGIDKMMLAGRNVGAAVDNRPLKTCPTLFVGKSGLGLGVVALDDVYIVQSRGAYDTESMSLGSDEFAVGAGASYTLEWAVYGNTTGDYYDFINAVRRDEGRNNVTVEGGWAFIPGSQHKRDASLAPPPEYYTIRNLRYAAIGCLSWCSDDASISLEGIEFVEYPTERRKVRELLDAVTKTRPDMMGMFHVAQQLYATNRPETLYPDSRVIQADGKHAVYPYEYANSSYFSRERLEDNWRWWIYYPTLENSYGKALLDSVDVMMDEMHCRGVFVDGFLWGYGGEYTYDRWDGHSADIDPKANTITRRKGSTLLLTQDAMIAYARKVRDKGGVVIANNTIPTRTIGREPLIVDKEINEGPYVHLSTTPVALGNPAAIGGEVDVYRDVLSKLEWGNLYFYYGEPAKLTYESVPARMYPITVQEIHRGIVKGKERVVTMRSGVYGWPGSRDLHAVYRYDARGHRVGHVCVTTADASSVRTEIMLGENESAVVEKVPVTVESTSPVNVVVERYDRKELVMTVNGQGTIKVVPRGGEPRSFELAGRQRIEIAHGN